MSTASTIDFLSPNISTPAVSWRRKLAWRGRSSGLVSPVLSSQGCYGDNGGFVFDYAPAVSGKLRLMAGSMAVMLVAGLCSAVYPVGQHRILAAKSLASPYIQQHVPAPAAVASSGTSQTTSVSTTKETPTTPKPAAPLIAGSTTAESAPAAPEYALKRDVYAFLPYWFVGKTEPMHYDKLSTLAYFGVEVAADGSLNHNEPGWAKLYSPEGQQMVAEVKQHQTRLVITYRSFNADQIASIINNPSTRERAANEIVKQVKDLGADGANIDFENAEHPDDAMRANFVAFAGLVTERMHQQVPGSEVMVSTYAAAAKYFKLYDVTNLSKVTDGLFVMAYDFFTVNSGHAGPVAPLTGGQGAYWYDVTSTVKDYLAVGVAANKMILGVPYYGYDWPVAENKAGAATTDGAANTSTYKGSVHDRENTSATRRWDEAAQVPYYSYYQNGSWRVTYYDDVASLGKKYDLVNQYNLKGTGIWALGQEGDAPELWQLLADKFGR